MIVRIAGEGQWRLPDDAQRQLNELDNAAVAAVEADDEDRFHELFEEMLQIVRERGRPLEDDELSESRVILPPADTSFVEAAGDFSGEGLIPEALVAD